MRRAALIVAAILAAACRKTAPPPVPAAQVAPERDADERPNLLNIGYGASVVSRTAELTLENSAIRAIDGDLSSPWNSPPSDTQQTIVFGLPAPTQIEQIGVRTAPGVFSVREALFETSSDGARFEALKLQRFEANDQLQLTALQTPLTTRYVRVTTSASDSRFATLSSVQVRGKFTGTPTAPPIDGCWTINGVASAFAASSHIGDLTLDGSVEGATYRYAWADGPEWGHALITLSPDGRHLSGIKWHEEPIAYNFGESWFGERCSPSSKTAATIGGAPLNLWLRKTGRYPLYGSAAETIAAVLARVPRIRLVSREFRGKTPEENRARAQARLDDLKKTLGDVSRIDFVVAGSEKPHQPIDNEAMRVLYSAVEIEIPAAARSAF